MKRAFQELTDLDLSLNIANCLIFMSQGRDDFDAVNGVNLTATNKVFECKTCSKRFSSFQALGGHRASHKKPRLTDDNGGTDKTSQIKPKTHECSVCGLEFALGQALGGHMRRHRAGALHGIEKLSELSSRSDTAPLVKKANNGRRVLCLDLNLTPYENDLEFYRLQSNKADASIVDCFL